MTCLAEEVPPYEWKKSKSMRRERSRSKNSRDNSKSITAAHMRQQPITAELIRMLAATRQEFQSSGSRPRINFMTTAITCCKTMIRRMMQPSRRKVRVAADECTTRVDLPAYSSSRSRREVHLAHLVAVLCGSSTHTCGKTTTTPRPPPSAITKTTDLASKKCRHRWKETTSSTKLSAIRAP